MQLNIIQHLAQCMTINKTLRKTIKPRLSKVFKWSAAKKSLIQTRADSYAMFPFHANHNTGMQNSHRRNKIKDRLHMFLLFSVHEFLH